MSEQEMLECATFCRRCHAQVRESDNYCHACGKSLKPGHGFLFTHTGIILMALVLGPFALPFVWMSRAISLLAKIIYTIILLAFGFYIVYYLVHVFTLARQSMELLFQDTNSLSTNLSGLSSWGSF